MKRVDLRSRGCHAFPQSSLGVWEARLGAFGSGQLVDDDVMPSPGAAGYLLRFNADAVPVEKALLAIVVLHAPKIAPRLQPMKVRSREARTDFAVQGSFQPRDGVADGVTVQRRSHALQGGLRPKAGFSALRARFLRGVHMPSSPTSNVPASSPSNVQPGQLWKDRQLQHYRVLEVRGGIATVRCATPDGHLVSMGQHSKDTVLIEGMQAGWQLVRYQ